MRASRPSWWTGSAPPCPVTPYRPPTAAIASDSEEATGAGLVPGFGPVVVVDPVVARVVVIEVSRVVVAPPSSPHDARARTDATMAVPPRGDRHHAALTRCYPHSPVWG